MMIKRSGGFFAMLGAILLCSMAVGPADVPDPTPARFGGIYKVASSNDPVFPAMAAREYFLDFGEGIRGGKLSGSVAVSVRMNPHVKVRILSWQYFPDLGRLVIGNPFAHGSRRAVAIGVWEIQGASNGAILQRGVHQVVLQRVGPDDY